MDCRFYVGQQVICVDDSDRADMGCSPEGTPYHDGLREGAVYTVRALEVAPSWFTNVYPQCRGEVWVHLYEIDRPRRAAPGAVGFTHTRFRPTTDISSLEALLRTAKPPVGKKEPA